MKLTTVIGSVNENPEYYRFIPYQIKFWRKFNINFYAVFVGEKIPNELLPYLANIFLWDKCLDLSTVYISQLIRIFYCGLLNLPDDEMVMITDMDMLPCNDKYYTSGLENFKIEDFIYFREIDYDSKEIYMCYNMAHPSVWRKIFNVTNKNDIENRLRQNYENSYSGTPGEYEWGIDQRLLYNKLTSYSHLHVLNRPINRIETWTFGYCDYNSYDDCHFHRSFSKNYPLILKAEKQLKLS